jgi:hypothetical protein
MPANRDQERLEKHEKLLNGIQAILASEINDARSVGDKPNIARLARVMLNSIEASLRVGEIGGAEGGQSEAVPYCITILAREGDEPKDLEGYRRYLASLPTEEEYAAHQRTRAAAAVILELPANGYETPQRG